MTLSRLLEPYQFAFFRHGVIVATLAGGICRLIGVYVVLRGMSYIGHGLSRAHQLVLPHAVAPPPSSARSTGLSA